MRKVAFVEEEYYHIYNRGVDKREVFADDVDYNRFLKDLKEFNNELIREERNMMQSLGMEIGAEFDSGSESNSEERSVTDPLVEIVAYCLNPNHYHLILKQVAEKGIERFMQKLGTGYTNYFNKKNERSGALFQGKFKAIHIDSNEYLLHLSAYVNRNYFIHGYSAKGDWIYCSEPDYLSKLDGGLCDKNVILDQFGTKSEFDSDYGEFLEKSSEYFKDKKEMERYMLE